VFERFGELTKGKMALLISHRFSTVRMADRIVVLENGTIVEQGSHDALIGTDGRYAQMFELRRPAIAENIEVRKDCALSVVALNTPARSKRAEPAAS
jgi:ABC-type glutathione transport system ATPase component